MEAAARNSFDLLISDIALPDGTGTELMTYLRAISRIPGIAISTSYVATNAEVKGSLNRDLSGSASTVTITNVIPLSTFYEPNGVKQLDLRLIRNFKLGRTHLQGIFDIFNAFNARPVLNDITRYTGTTGGAWLRPTSTLVGRLLKFGVQFEF